MADPALGERIESVHNYIDFEAGIIRKGAISAQKDQLLVIPLNMRDGCVFGRGLGNAEWNYSAPHGAGRRMSRCGCKEKLDMETYKQSMVGVYSSSVTLKTLDECPDAYKNAETVLDFI